ncbi:MAG: beta-galactosidase [Candidatus Coatesbacteria bacterium]
MTPQHWSIKKTRGVHWLVSPEGRRMIYTSVQCVGPKHGSKVAGAPAYDGIASAGGTLLGWVEKTESRLKAWGLKGLGAWNHRLWRYRDVPYTECLNIWKSLNDSHGLKGIFDADWATQAENLIRPQIEELRDAPSLVGWFLDNEIPWGLWWFDAYFNDRKPGDLNRRAVLAFLHRRYRTIGRLNAAWGTSIRSWADLASRRKLPAPQDEARRDRVAFLSIVARKFFSTTCRIVRSCDAHRPILGVRYAGFPLPVVVAAQKGHTDVVSVNLYIAEGVFPVEEATRAHRLSGGQPVWVTEFSWHAPWDNRSGDRNTIGFGSRVRLQSSRGRAYERFVTGGASLPFVIGFDWFQWCDESPKGRGGDGEDVNFGLVDIHDRPYEGLVARIARANRALERVHARSGSWKLRVPKTDPLPFFAAPPLHALPASAGRAAVPLGTGGAELRGLRFRPSPDPAPKTIPVRASVGWSPRELRVVVDVRDAVRTVETAKPRRSIEWFWMTDAVELLLRTGTEDAEALDAKSVKIWAVPDGEGRGRPYVGAIRNHVRVAGAASGARVRQSRIPGGYRMEFRVAAATLQPGPFRPFQVLRFNLLVEDCEKVLEVCWSSHQGEWTTEKPKTWGRLALVP